MTGWCGVGMYYEPARFSQVQSLNSVFCSLKQKGKEFMSSL